MSTTRTPTHAADSRPVLVVGESLVDVVTTADGRTVERPGGSAANVAVALARLGQDVLFATAYADDDRGRSLVGYLSGSGVGLATDPHVLDHTSSAQARIADDGAATYTFDLDWRFGPVEATTVEAAVAVHACSIGAVLAPGADDVLALLDRAVAAGTLVSYDVNARPAITGTGPDLVARVEAVVALAHLVKASDEDLASLYPTRSTDEAAAHLRTLGPAVVVVTRGGEGSTWYAATRVDAPAATTEVVDTIGAGDTFSAALVDGLVRQAAGAGGSPTPATLLEQADATSLLVHAARAAAVTVGRPGCDPPTRAELDTAG